MPRTDGLGVQDNDCQPEPRLSTPGSEAEVNLTHPVLVIRSQTRKEMSSNLDRRYDGNIQEEYHPARGMNRSERYYLWRSMQIHTLSIREYDFHCKDWLYYAPYAKKLMYELYDQYPGGLTKLPHANDKAVEEFLKPYRKGWRNNTTDKIQLDLHYMISAICQIPDEERLDLNTATLAYLESKGRSANKPSKRKKTNVSTNDSDGDCHCEMGQTCMCGTE